VTYQLSFQKQKLTGRMTMSVSATRRHHAPNKPPAPQLHITPIRRKFVRYAGLKTCSGLLPLRGVYAIAQRFFRPSDAPVHTERTRVATITRLKFGSWRAKSDERGNMSTRHFSAEKDAYMHANPDVSAETLMEQKFQF
jgi:hypothetical protein